MIAKLQKETGQGVRTICRVLDLPRSSFYHAARPAPRQEADRQLADRLEACFHQHRRRYGYRRLCHELRSEGLPCGQARVRRLMRTRQLHALQPRRYVPRTSDGRADAPSPNLLASQPLPARPNEVWAGDITHIPTRHGWLYLAVVIELPSLRSGYAVCCLLLRRQTLHRCYRSMAFCSRRVVGWALADHMRAGLVTDALQRALHSRCHTRGLIFHSDRGSQYGSRLFRQLLRNSGLRQSMSARANPYHNAWSESLIGTLKTEMLQEGCFIDEQDARTELFAYIDGYYNTIRRHSSLDYLSPASFEAKFSLHTYLNN